MNVLYKTAAAFIAGLAVAALSATCAVAASAPWKPQKNVEIVVPTSPGSGLDTMARTMEVIFRERKLLETSATVSNRAGGGTSVGLAYLSQRAGDPHVLFMNVASVLAGHITGQSQFNYTDLAPLAFLALAQRVCGDKSIRYAEVFQRFEPFVGRTFDPVR